MTAVLPPDAVNPWPNPPRPPTSTTLLSTRHFPFSPCFVFFETLNCDPVFVCRTSKNPFCCRSIIPISPCPPPTDYSHTLISPPEPLSAESSSRSPLITLKATKGRCARLRRPDSVDAARQHRECARLRSSSLFFSFFFPPPAENITKLSKSSFHRAWRGFQNPMNTTVS